MKGRLPTRRVVLALIVLVAFSSKAATVSEGWAAYEKGDVAKAYDIFRQLIRESPDDENINFGYGMAALAMGKLSHAAFAFERVLQINPGNHRARLELARTYAVMERYTRAEQEFRYVLDAGPPERVQRNIETYLAWIHRRTRKWSGGGQVGGTVFYDDNVNFGPSSRMVDTLLGPLEVSSNSMPRDSWGLALGGAGVALRDLGGRGDWFARGALTGYANWLFDAPDQEMAYARVELGPRYAGPRAIWDFPFKADYLEVGHERYLWMAGVEPTLMAFWTEGWDGVTRGSIERREFREDDTRDGWQYRLEQTVRRWIGRSRHYVALSVAGYFEDAQEKPYDIYGGEAQLSGEFRFTKSTALAGSVQYRSARYRDILLPALQDTERSDRQWQFSATLTQALTKRMGLSLTYWRVENRSNFGLYEFDRNVVSLSTYITF